MGKRMDCADDSADSAALFAGHSPFVEMFGVEARPARSGRPAREQGGAGATMFKREGKNKTLANQAVTRARAVVLREQRERVSELFEIEYAWLAAKAGIAPVGVGWVQPELSGVRSDQNG